MPGSQREVANAEEEGVIFEWLSAPKGFTGEGRVTGVMVQKMRLGAPDATGRQAPEVIEGADYVEEADLVIKALGFEPEDLPALWDQPELKVTRWGTIRAEFTSGATEMDGVYAVGDIVRGASPGGLGDPRRARLRSGDPGTVRDAGGAGGGVSSVRRRYHVGIASVSCRWPVLEVSGRWDRGVDLHG